VMDDPLQTGSAWNTMRLIPICAALNLPFSTSRKTLAFFTSWARHRRPGICS